MRRVRRLQISAPSEALRRRGQLLLEDALHTASLPGADEARLWLVRSLRLGLIDSRAGAAQLARTIEERIRHAGLMTCAGGDPAAAAADVVVFASALEASIALAVRLGRGKPVRGWYWPLAVPAYRPGAAPAEGLKALLLATIELPGGAAASAAWLEAVVEANAGEPLLASLSAPEAEGLLRLGGWEPVASASAREADQVAAAPGLTPAWRGPLERWLPRWGAADPRGLWLVAMALVAAQPARLGSPALLRQARALLRSEAQALASAGAPAAPSPSPLSPASPSGSPVPPEAANSRPTTPLADQAPVALGTADRRGGSARGRTHQQSQAPSGDWVAQQPEPAVAAQPVPRPFAALDGHGELSAAAGLAFVVVLLQRMGIELWLARHPALLDVDWPRRLLHGVADGLGVPPRDPLRVALGLDTLAPLPNGGAARFEDRAVLAAVSRHWRRRLERWCRQPGCLPLPQLVRRPGAVLASRTHLDLWFQPRQAEIRVRRHGLDLDPGWVPWLGRVITFHYATRGPADGQG
jgi:hypothetical protein